MESIKNKMPIIDHNMKRVRAKVPPLYQNLEPASSFSCAKEGLYISGSSGVGKTHKAIQFFFRWAKDMGSSQCQFWDVPELLETCRKEYDSKPSIVGNEYGGRIVAYKSKLDICKQTGLLVLDDLGSEKLTEWAAERLGLIINYRYGYMLPTIVTSNLCIDEIGAVTSQRIASRLSVLPRLSIDGEDKRSNQE